ncbi:hypothetical protein MMC14_009055 [Varicellaria rhodocarpa]|nr:hypothetical protein [Varicellaria rhodocarpa]
MSESQTGRPASPSSGNHLTRQARDLRKVYTHDTFDPCFSLEPAEPHAFRRQTRIEHNEFKEYHFHDIALNTTHQPTGAAHDDSLNFDDFINHSVYDTVNGSVFDAQLQNPPFSHNGFSTNDASVINGLTEEAYTRPIASGSTYHSNFDGLNNLNVASTNGSEAVDSSNTDTYHHLNHISNQLPPMIIGRTTRAATNMTATVNNLTCPHQGCDVRVRRANDLPRHMQLHSPPHIDCTVGTCNRKGARGFRREDKLRDHLRQGHGIIN